MVALRSESGVESGLDASTMFRRVGNDPVGPTRVAGFVGDQHSGGSVVAAVSKQAQDRFTGLRVERSGGFVGEDQTAFTDDGTSDGDALALPAGHIVGEPVGKFVDADFAQ